MASVVPSSSFNEDPSSPYHLHNGDSTRSILVSLPLDGENYQTWSRSMIMAITAKNKLGFLDGSLSKLLDDSGSESCAWVRCNTMVRSWILNSVSKEIASSVIYIENTADVWVDLKEWFSQKKKMAHTFINFINLFLLFLKRIFLWELISPESNHFGMS
jgi:hypothetical protein